MDYEKMTLLICYNHLKDCLRFEILEEKEYICDKVSLIKLCKENIPTSVYKKIEEFIEKNIYPMLFDNDYFSFYLNSELGTYDENGIFCFYSDEHFERAIRLRKAHVSRLNEDLDIFATEHLLFNIPQVED